METNYLGHNITHGEIRPSPDNIRGLLNTRIPTTAAEACKFVKGAEYYRKLIPNFSIIAEPLRKFVPTTKTERRKQQKQHITLNSVELHAFEELKQILTSDLVLRLPNNNYQHKLQTDASDESVGAVLLQIYPEGDRPVGFLSKRFTNAQRKWTPTEQECFALICAINKWSVYLTGTKFTWDTDHQALIHLKNKAQTNKRCERWRLKIAEFDIKIKHIRGIHNSMPDYLSRSPVDPPEDDPDEIVETLSKSTQTEDETHPVVAVVQTRSRTKLTPLNNQTSSSAPSSPSDNKIAQHLTQIPDEANRIFPFSLGDLKRAQQADEQVQKILSNTHQNGKYIVKNELLMRRKRPPVPFVPKGESRSSILKIYHDTPANGAHFGRDKTIYKIKQRYYWPSMIKDIKNYVQSCITCAQFNPQRRKPPGALKPIPPPSSVFQLLTMDVHGPISPTSKRGNKYIISLTDVLSKFVIAKAVRDCSAMTAVRFIKEEVIMKYGTPKCILTDNGSHFTANMMQELFKQIGVTHIYSTPYHPQTNGQIERFNSTMDAKIATLCNDNKTDWDDQLPFVIFNYNTSIHAITKQVPFEMTFGRSPVLPFDHQDLNVVLSQDPEYLSKLNSFLSSSTAQARQNIIKNQQQYKKRYDINRSNPKYAINDLVLVKTLNPRHKFDIRYEGPFRIIQQLASKTFIVEHVKKLPLRQQVTVDVLIPLFERRN
ncbi:unnamed protein product [Didymodactylos carnosus]|uniref:Integrase catalytic domain-containing protein n=1 Tax=Didymodactylos carnosus TaxID=1234261 RepID=A0A8S2K644_9BILA|nr:unnamed protein product [Didymodactylos carnosus]CAF3840579.1 unnamed protein product [Didymodactylos carnosus]